ncbi:MAG: NifU family protein [Actinobacteria bacterium]|nr:NifU family protein [Actinomycetota bacterium]
MPSLGAVLERMEALLTEVEALDEPVRSQVFELLDGVDAVHRMALERLGAELGDDRLAELRDADPAVAWLLDAYSVGIDERRAAEEAIETVRPYVHSHGGEVEVLGADRGVVRVRLSGACSGCTASAVTLQEGVVEALRKHVPGFAALEVEEDGVEAQPHPPPGPTLVEIRRRDQ